jgi:hypothetical protein
MKHSLLTVFHFIVVEHRYDLRTGKHVFIERIKEGTVPGFTGKVENS